MSEQSVSQALQRLISIPWKADEDKDASQLALMDEYFRRIALWNMALELPSPEEEFYYPFLDIGDGSQG